MGSLQSILIFTIVVTILGALISMIPCRVLLFIKIQEKIKYSFVYSWPIRLYTVLYLPILVLSMINLTAPETEGYGVSMMFIVIAILIPLGVWFFFRRFQKTKFKDPDFKSKFGSLYQEFDVENPKADLIWAFFFARRFVLAFTLVVFRNMIGLQIAINMVFSFFMFLYTFKYKQFEIEVQNLLELFNEGNNLLMLLLTAIMATRSIDD
jgi:hypothetical protein